MSNAASLQEQWRREKDPAQRSILWEQIVQDIDQEAEKDDYERAVGLYPDVEDENFLPKLMRKFEFQELKQESVKTQMDIFEKEKKDPCATGEGEEFSLTQTQKFVSRFLNPRTPYRSALIYHGVGVGKTCTAITIAESFLDMFPNQKILLVAPKNIQAGFKREIFDINSVSLAKTAGGKNHHKGCTGDIYLQLTNSFGEQSLDLIQTRVTKIINTRYQFLGYTSFSKYIENKIEIAAKYPNAEEMKRQIIREEFSNRVLIVDEAHNLRDENLEGDDDDADDASIADTSEGRAGKQLTPFLLDVLRYAENISLVLMTATPMYNSYREIIFLLNLLLLNEKRTKDLLNEREIFDLKTELFRPGGDVKLGRIASQYVSFMRGENPLKFPVRLEPEGDTRLENWATTTLRGEEIPEVPRDAEGKLPVEKLPLIEAYFSDAAEEAYYEYSRGLVEQKGLGITVLDKLVQVGNFIFPGEEDVESFEIGLEDRLGKGGFSQTFEKESVGSIVQYRDVRTDRKSSWMVGETLQNVSAKTYILLERLNSCVGVSFVFSRFVDAGALAIALALEANGYLPWGRDIPLLADGNRHPDGMQCALCNKRERGHGKQPADENGRPEHLFRQARYILITGSDELSPNNAKAIQASRAPSNKYGADVKVILGSQVTSVGLDFKFIREIFVFDSWYHLNKLDQVVGRGIRNCSHALLPPALRNCTVSLLINRFSDHQDVETVDMQSYRIALSKAVSVGQVTRVLKAYAVDCSLNRNAILIEDLDEIPMRDSQNNLRPAVNRNDMPFTAMCDWLDSCSYTCKTGSGEELDSKVGEDVDYSTYDEFMMRQHRQMLKKYLVYKITNEQAFLDFETIKSDPDFLKYPPELLRSLLNEMILDKERITSTTYGQGYIVYRNGYYVFQPDTLPDVRVPLAIRLARIPVPRDHYPPRKIDLPSESKEVFEGVTMSKTEASDDLWEEVQAWAKSIRDGTAILWELRARGEAFQNVPRGVLSEVKKLRQSVGIYDVQAEKLEMITWIYTAVQTDAAARNALANAMLQFMWDEFITVGTQKELILTNPDDTVYRDVSKESYWLFKGRPYIRFRNYLTDSIEYYCPGSSGYEVCSDARVEDLKRGKAVDPLLQKPIDITTTGFQYGFIAFNPKVGQIIFKRGEPPAVGKKVGRGAVCASSSQTGYERRNLEKYGDALRAAGKHDFGLNAAYMGLAERHVENSVRICMLSNLTLRYMDAERIQGKRWFYRPIESKLQGHPQPRT